MTISAASGLILGGCVSVDWPPDCVPVVSQPDSAGLGHRWRASELVKGLVLHLDPDVFENSGGTYTGTKHHRVKGPHFFICAARISDAGIWFPLMERSGPGRHPIPMVGRTGPPKWTEGSYHFHEAQRWPGSTAAVVNELCGAYLARTGR